MINNNKPAMNLQDSFLNHVRKENLGVVIYLMNGFQLRGMVRGFDNFTVINKSEPPLYELFAKSHYQIGAFSTAIYEGLAFNCKTFIIDVPGVEYLDDLIDKDIVKKVKSSEELINYINNGNISIQEYDKDYFFKNFDETIFKKILSD